MFINAIFYNYISTIKFIIVYIPKILQNILQNAFTSDLKKHEKNTLKS